LAQHIANDCFKAPKARDVTAWGNAPGTKALIREALKARNEVSAPNDQSPVHFAPSALLWFVDTPLGRCPRPLHFAPSALSNKLDTV
jgi:hypothetical protein